MLLVGVLLAPSGAKRLQVSPTIARDDSGATQVVTAPHAGSKAAADQLDAEPAAAASFSHVRNHKVGALVAMLLVFSAATALISIFQHYDKFRVTESEKQALIQSEQLAKDLKQKVGDKFSPTANGVSPTSTGIAPWEQWEVSEKASAANEKSGGTTPSGVSDPPEDTASAESIA